VNVAVLDFETEAIQARPVYPPRPVGFALSLPNAPTRYYGWAHPSENNCTKEEAHEVLVDLWKGNLPVVFHNAKFDLEVAAAAFGLPVLPWHRVHDTMLLLFLDNPHASTFALKPAAEAYLNLPPSERDAVRDWLVEQGVCRSNDKGWGAHIAKAPGGLVGTYAIGDVDRTRALFDRLAAQQGAAYDRERRLLPILLQNERDGMRVDLRRLRRDTLAYTDALFFADDSLRALLGTPGLNVDSDRELADALDAGGHVTDWAFTPTGQKSVAKDALREEFFVNPDIWRLLAYRNKLTTSLTVFMRPWLATAEATGGRIHTNWNQIRQMGSGSGFAGARTGRLSSNPNFQNLPKAWKLEAPAGLPPLPLLRSYILPDVGGLFVHRDYSQQELRILAHYEDGALREAYCANPRMDVHEYVQQQIAEKRGLSLDRGRVKTLNFGMLYGMGMAKLAEALGCSVGEAQEIKAAQRAALPGIAQLEYDIKLQGKTGGGITTWGDRFYRVEEPQIVDGQQRTFEYKLLNYLIQGSAADCTKEALCRYDEAKVHGRLLCTVHDEINISVPHAHVESEMQILKDCMESVEFDVPMLTDGKTGAHWGALKGYHD